MDQNESEVENEDIFLPECTAHGEFQLQQCFKDQCWCVDPQGSEIEGSRKEAPATNAVLDFQCDGLLFIFQPPNFHFFGILLQ